MITRQPCRTRYLVGAVLTVLLVGRAQAAPLFESEEELPITLSAPFELINVERDKEKEYEGTLSYEDPELGPVTLDAKFSVRGKYRLRRDICSHAQLWVNLKKKQVKGTLFAGQNKLKLVVQCKERGYYTEYVAREEQAYRIFSLLSDLSLATRRLQVTYADSETGERREELAVFLQHHDSLGNDNGMTQRKEPNPDKALLNPDQVAIVGVFMYLVANTDYSFTAAPPGESCCHNIKLLEDEQGELFPIPYDFDSTGFVNARYATPAASIGQRNVRQRIYRGYCVEPETLQRAVAKVQAAREQIYAIAAESRYVSERSLKQTEDYIDDFYEVLETPRKFERNITEACLGSVIR